MPFELNLKSTEYSGTLSTGKMEALRLSREGGISLPCKGAGHVLQRKDTLILHTSTEHPM